MSCPDMQTWEDYAHGQGSDEEREQWGQHLDTCPACRATMEQIQANEILLRQLKTLDLGTPSATSESPVSNLDLDTLQGQLGTRYRIMRHVSTTWHSEVFQALDTVLERQVAFKVLKPSPNQQDHDWQEARTLGKLNHPAIGQLFEIGTLEEQRFIVLEWVDGLPLTEAWQGLNTSQRLRLLLEVAEAMAFAHRHGVVHRDLKPSNILVTAELHPKILDFGLALETQYHPQTQHHFRGTPAYCAPEQIQSQDQIGPATDVFALGILLYQMLTDSHPFTEGQAQDLFDAVVHDHPALPSALAADVPAALQNICLKALEKNPSQRYAHADELAHDLQRHLRGEKVWAQPSFLADQVQQELFQHRQKLKVWRDNELITQLEYDRLEKVYEHMTEPPDPSIIESRRLSLSQVCLYLGGWIVVLGCVVLFYKTWEQIPRLWRPAPALGATFILGLIGTLLWRSHENRLAIGFLTTTNLLIPLSLGLTLAHWHWLMARQCPWGDESINHILQQCQATLLLGNTQLYLTAWCWLAVSLGWLWWTRSSIFMHFTICAGLALWTVTLLIQGMIGWTLATAAGHYLLAAAVLILGGILLDRGRLQRYAGSPALIGMGLMIASITFIALSNQTLFGWLGLTSTHLTNNEQRLLGLCINGLLYLGLAHLYQRINTPLHRGLSHTFNWLGPLHLLAPLRLLDMDALDQNISHQLIYRIALPVVSLGCIIASVTRQMKSFFFSGLGGIAASIHKITTAHLSGIFAWPVSLILAGISSMLVSWWVPRWQARRRLQKTGNQSSVIK